jgi:hypothetical protein
MVFSARFVPSSTISENYPAKVAESAQDFSGKGVLFQPHHSRALLLGGATQQHTATAATSAALSCTNPPCHSWRNEYPSPLRHNQVPSQSVQTPNANSSPLYDMFTVVTTIFQQIMTELNGAKSEKDRIMVITKIVLKLMVQNDRKSS